MKLSQFFYALENRKNCNFFLSTSTLAKDYVQFSIRDISFILNEIDPELEYFVLDNNDLEEVCIYAIIANSEFNDLLKLKKQREDKIQYINQCILNLERQRDLL